MLPKCLPAPFPPWSGWDQLHGISWDMPLGELVLALFDKSLGLKAAGVYFAALGTAVPLAFLCLLDSVSVLYPQGPVAAQLEYHNTQCYDEMFCEPTRASLVKRPNSIYSNFWYIFGAFCVSICMGARHAFWVADACFAFMLLTLGASLWSACQQCTGLTVHRPLEHGFMHRLPLYCA